MRFPAVFLMIALAGCGEPVRDDHFANDMDAARAPSPAVISEELPVRIGEQGSNFDACNAAGTTRRVAIGQRLPVRAAPFDTAAEIGGVPPGTRFFICTRSIDQKWFGIVYEDAGALEERCGVSQPVTSRGNYQGPCASGWVASAFVKLISGVDAGPAAIPPQAAPSNSTEPSN